MDTVNSLNSTSPIQTAVKEAPSLSATNQVAVSQQRSQGFDSVSLSEIKEIVAVANATLQIMNNSLKFRVDEVVEKPIVTVVDQDSGKVVRQLPSEELVRIAHSIESMKGVLFDATI